MKVGSCVSACAVLLVCLLSAPAAEAQLARLVAPGPLSKAHASLEGVNNCQKCHQSGSGISAQRCLGCHKPIADRITARRGVHKNATECGPCHKEHKGAAADLRRLDAARFNHAVETGFALDGRHAEVAQKCASCHKTRSFLKADTRCGTCHRDPHKPTLGPKCETCHQVAAAFRDTRTRYDHSKTAFALEGSHQRVECAKCHVNKVYRGLKFTACSDCHRDPHDRRFTAACSTCHTVEAWRTQKIDHAKTGFALRGKHADTKCAACHTQSPVKVKLSGERCTSCHTDAHQGEFRQECNACHTEQGWRGVKLDHQARTKSGYALAGKHADAACTACHKAVKLTAAGSSAPRTTGKSPAAGSIDFRGLSTACASCHGDPHRSELGTACEKCHTPNTFRIASFTHPGSADFFAGQHAGVACARCHAPRAGADGAGEAGRVSEAGAAGRAGGAGGTARPLDGWKFRNVQKACASCHRDVHLGQLGASCETCHAVAGAKFAAVSFSHARAAFTLTGKHQDAPCAKCHKSETGAFPAGNGTAVRLKGLSTACASCHQDKHLGQVGNRCDTCHTTGSFKIPAYRHADKPGFFVGGHAAAKCQDCHKEQEGAFPAGRGAAVRYKGFGTSCVTCHADRHAGGLGRECATCHEPTAWRVVSRAFHKTGVFPLEGRHLSVECASCHQNGVIKGTPTRCYDCHWLRRQDDRYRTRLGTDCETCHRPMSWVAVNWNHEQRTNTRLSPVHRALGCESCHKTQDFKAATASCTSCHQQDYVRAMNPNHAAAGFPTNCDVCHRVYQGSWQQAVFNHNAKFPLVGTHAGQACATCHKDGVYQGRPHDCYSCHKADYDRTQSPNHAAAGYSTTCEGCHRATDGSFKGGATFNHNAAYQLVGLHATQACAACHKNNVYKGTSRDCYACHQANYAQAKNPNHAAAGYATTCESCHKPTDPDWLRATTSHVSFALVGIHATQPCAACHRTGAYAGTPRDCYSCHQANYTQTRNPNHAAAGYPTTCESCHKPTDPDWLRATTSHTSFALVGVHATQPCAACHRNGVYAGTPRDCYSCHQANYNQTTNPNHAAAGFATTCDGCHKASDPNWLAAAYAHTTYSLVGVHATQPCSACHRSNVYRGTPRDCYSCHQANYNQTTNPNHAAAGFPTTCESCHKATDATWQQAVFNHTWFPNTGRHAASCSTCHPDRTNYKVFTCLVCHDRASTDSHHVGRAGYRYDSQACYSCHPRG